MVYSTTIMVRVFNILSFNAIATFYFGLLFNRLPLFGGTAISESNKTQNVLPEINGDNFYYFGYGSNMLTKRIHVQNPTAVKIGAALLKNYRLDFNGYTGRWKGAPATIVPENDAVTYGTLWSINLSNLPDIDSQEGVPDIYTPLSVPVVLQSDGSTLISRAYHLVTQPTSHLNDYNDGNLPLDRQPSKTYLQCLVKGAQETGLPAEYIRWLQSVKHNGAVAPKLENLLDLNNTQLLT